MAPKVSDAHQEARKKQILEAALACFADKGFHKTTMRDICTAANLSTGAVYSYFENKEVLIQALNEWGRHMNQTAFNAGELEAASPREGLSKILRAFILRAEDPTMRTAIRADAMFMAEALTDPELAEYGCAEYEHQLLGTIVAMVEQLQDVGCIEVTLESRAVAEVLFSLVQGAYWQLLVNPQLDLNAYVKAAESAVFGLLWKTDNPDCIS